MARRSDVQYDLNQLWKLFGVAAACEDDEVMQLAANSVTLLTEEAAAYDAELRARSACFFRRQDMLLPEESMWRHLWTFGTDTGLMHFCRAPRAVLLVRDSGGGHSIVRLYARASASSIAPMAAPQGVGWCQLSSAPCAAGGRLSHMSARMSPRVSWLRAVQ